MVVFFRLVTTLTAIHFYNELRSDGNLRMTPCVESDSHKTAIGTVRSSPVEELKGKVSGSGVVRTRCVGEAPGEEGKGGGRVKSGNSH